MNKDTRLPKNVVLNMLEFYRRQHVIGNGEVKKLGNLAFPSEMKQTIELGLAKPYSNDTPRVLNWYSLTLSGIKVLQEYERNGLTPDAFSGYDLVDHDLYLKLSSLGFQT